MSGNVIAEIQHMPVSNPFGGDGYITMTNSFNTDVQKLGQSFWYDNIQRRLINSGELQDLITHFGVLGITSNPSIFDKAISQSTDYDEDIVTQVRQGKDTKSIYESLAISDIQAAADLLLPVYERTKGVDGYISLEVSPTLARDTQETVAEARRLRDAVARRNLMIKVPATPEGIPAIEQLIAEGIHVNVTLIFSPEVYEQVARAYMAGLKARADKGLSLDVASVASFFVSRVDTLVDKLLDEKMAATPDAGKKSALGGLKHKAAIANAKLAYQLYKKMSAESGWKALAKAGANPQRPLWASTSTKDPSLPDTFYADALIGKDTVNTLPPATLKAFNDHGKVAATLEKNTADATSTMKALEEAGINLQGVWQKLQDDGVKQFADAFDSMMRAIDTKRDSIVARGEVSGDGVSVAEVYVEELAASKTATRIWQRDASVWTTAPEHIKVVNNRLGWLSSIDIMRGELGKINTFVNRVKAEGYTDAVVLGMGGSSVAPSVFAATFEKAPGALNLHVLDTTDPLAVSAFSKGLDLKKTLFLVASKSGGTIEVRGFYEFFRAQADDKLGDSAGEHFVAITDEGSPLDTLSESEMFRTVFYNPDDIGGRYSALSYFGLLPAALMGVDVGRLLDRAEQMANWCMSDSPLNPGLWLGALLGGLSLAGKDKIMLICASKVEAMGLWIEQLIGESTGKQGRGIVAVEGDLVNMKRLPELTRDRVYVYTAYEGDTGHDKLIAQIEKLKLPLITLRMKDEYDIAAEFFRWEFATVVAGSIIGVDPFDEPNVTESKVNTKRLLEEHEESGVFASEATSKSANSQINKFLRSAKEGDYVAIHAYLPYGGEMAEQLQKFRQLIGEKTDVPVSLGYGPRFLHSTGQLHKGGANNVVAVQLTYDVEDDVPIAGAPYTFGTLIRAQALGDYEALRAHSRRVIRMHLGYDAVAGLKKLMKTMKGATRKVKPGGKKIKN